MNVHVDTLATDYLDNYSAPSKIVPLILASKEPASLSTVKLSHDYSPNDSEKQLAAHDFARNSWKGTTGPNIPSTPSTGMFQAKPLTPWRTAPKSPSSNLHNIIFQLYNTCTESNERQTTNAQPASLSQKQTGIFSVAPVLHSGAKSSFKPQERF